MAIQLAFEAHHSTDLFVKRLYILIHPAIELGARGDGVQEEHQLLTP